MSAAVRRYLAIRENAERRISELLKKDHPPGSGIEWEGHQRTPCFGTVVDNGHGDRIKVRNNSTGREYWIYAYRIAS